MATNPEDEKVSLGKLKTLVDHLVDVLGGEYSVSLDVSVTLDKPHELQVMEDYLTRAGIPYEVTCEEIDQPAITSNNEE